MSLEDALMRDGQDYLQPRKFQKTLVMSGLNKDLYHQRYLSVAWSRLQDESPNITPFFQEIPKTGLEAQGYLVGNLKQTMKKQRSLLRHCDIAITATAKESYFKEA